MKKVAGLGLLLVSVAVWAPARSEKDNADQLHQHRLLCLLLAEPVDYFTRIEAPAAVTDGRFRPDAVTINVNYGPGFSSFPQAEAAFQYAVEIWKTQLTSPISVTVQANFSSLGSGILGSAGYNLVYRDFPGATMANTWFPGPIANALRGSVLASSPQITASFNNAFTWYFGTDGQPPAGQYDFVSVVLHELGHGVGFAGSTAVSGGVGQWGLGSGFPFIYDRYLANSSNHALTNTGIYPNNSSALAAQLTSNDVFWAGGEGITANGGTKPKLYAPTTWSSGSSIAHLDDSTYPAGNANSLMTHALGSAEAIHNPGPVTRGILKDSGWTLDVGCSYSLSATSVAVGRTGVNGTVGVTANTGCSWTAASNDAFVTVTSNASATGSASVGYSVAANTGAARSGTMTIAGQTFTVTQAGVTAPQPPTGVTATRGNGQVTVSFTAPTDNGGSSITSYRATASPGGATATGSGSPIVVTGLTNGTAYTFTVTATNSVGTSAASTASGSVTPATTPGAPTGVFGEAGDAQVSVGFTTPSSNGGDPITSYTATSSPGGRTASASSSPIIVTGLTNGTAYTFTVSATNSIGTSPASSASSSVTPSAGAATVPGAPTNVTGTSGNGQVSVSFTAPSTNGGAAITSYTATASPGGATATGASSPIVVSGLTNGTAYTFTVTATNAVGTGPASSASAAVTPLLPAMSRSPSALSFGATNNGGTLSNITSAQAVTVTFAGVSPAWTATTSTPWLQIGGGSGTGNGQFTVSVIGAPGLPASGTTTGTITITSSSVSNSPQTVTVNLTLYASSSSGSPFGSFDTPIHGATGLSGAIPVTGWALDDIEVTRVEIWRDRVPGEPTPVFTGPGPGNGKIYIADPLFVVGARPDVEAANPTVPFAYRAGWGYLMLTQGLWNQGNGTYTLYAFAYDKDGHSTVLGSKTITSNNATATKPFGGIDVPAYGQTVSGSFWNFGWALTPNATPPCTITNGNVFMAIDSGPLTPVNYGDTRTDIAAAFPGFSNGSGAGGAFYLDTTTLTNGVHQIGWYIVDNCNRAEGVGSRFFTVLNGSSTVPTDERAGASTLDVMPSAEPVMVRRSDEQQLVLPNAQADRVVTVAQGERIEVQLPSHPHPYTGMSIVNGDRRALPLGSSLDASTGTFYWEPGSGFLGAQDLEFTAGDQGPVWVRVIVGTSVQAVIDTPRPGPVDASFVIAGWAIDQAATTGTGIDTVHVWAYPASGGEPIFLGVAEYGDTRADIAATFGDQFGNASYSLAVTILAPGDYRIVVYPRSSVTGDFRGARAVSLTVR